MRKRDINVGRKYTDGKGNIRLVTWMQGTDDHPLRFVLDYEIVREGWANQRTKGCMLETFAIWAKSEVKP